MPRFFASTCPAPRRHGLGVGQEPGPRAARRRVVVSDLTGWRGRCRTFFRSSPSSTPRAHILSRSPIRSTPRRRRVALHCKCWSPVAELERALIQERTKDGLRAGDRDAIKQIVDAKAQAVFQARQRPHSAADRQRNAPRSSLAVSHSAPAPYGSSSLSGRWIYWSGSIRARNNSMPARPNMARLSVFNLLIWPSAWPLLHGSAIAFLTASMSRANIRANCCRA